MFVFRQVTTVPLIDSISGNQYTFQPQAGGDANGFARGAWDWSLMWKRVPLGKKERERREHTTEPYRYTRIFKTSLFLSSDLAVNLTT